MTNQKMRISQSNGSCSLRVVSFVAIFSGLWLFVEPLLAFIGIPDHFTNLGIWGYVLLIFIALILTVLIGGIRRRKARGNIVFLPFKMILTESGESYEVEAPQNMRTGVFVELFIDKLKRTTRKDSGLVHSKLYDNFLFIKKNESDWTKTDSDKTLLENDVDPGSLCKIVGYIKEQEKLYEYMRDVRD